MSTFQYLPASSTTFSLSQTPASSYDTRPSLQDHELDHDEVPLTSETITRSKSPTPSEKEELKEFEGILRKMFRKESWKNRGFLIGMAVFVFIITITILIGVFQDKIVKALVPAAEWVRKAPAGWLIPIVILVVLSIPPLFGAEIVHILCGLTYGLWLGFLIVSVGTAIGETITFFMFRSCLRSRAEKMERGVGGYARLGALARVIREGGFFVTLVVRYSAFPTHITTALFAVCGVTFLMFILTLTLSLPRQLAAVYIGVLAKEAAEGHPSKLDQTMSTVVLVITIVITVVAMHWIQYRLKSAALSIIRERRAHAKDSDNLEIQPFDPSALYDAEAARGAYSLNTTTHYDTSYPPTPVPASRAAA